MLDIYTDIWIQWEWKSNSEQGDIIFNFIKYKFKYWVWVKTWNSINLQEELCCSQAHFCEKGSSLKRKWSKNLVSSWVYFRWSDEIFRSSVNSSGTRPGFYLMFAQAKKKSPFLFSSFLSPFFCIPWFGFCMNVLYINVNWILILYI